MITMKFEFTGTLEEFSMDRNFFSVVDHDYDSEIDGAWGFDPDEIEVLFTNFNDVNVSPDHSFKKGDKVRTLGTIYLRVVDENAWVDFDCERLELVR